MFAFFNRLFKGSLKINADIKSCFEDLKIQTVSFGELLRMMLDCPSHFPRIKRSFLTTVSMSKN